MLLPSLIYLEQQRVQTVIIKKYILIQRVALLLTFSRAGWAMYIIYKSIDILMSDRKVKIIKSAIKWILLVGTITVLALSFATEMQKYALRKMISGRMIFTKEAKLLSESTGIAEPRLEMLRNSLMIIQETPLTGVGPSMQATLYLKKRKPAGITTAEVSGLPGIFAQFGLIAGGIGTLALLYLLLFARRSQGYKNEKAWFYMLLYTVLYAVLDMGFPSSFYFFMIFASVVVGSTSSFNRKVSQDRASVNRALS
jgi:O-antigen ligase